MRLSFVCVHVTLYFLALLDVSGSSCIFPASALDSFPQETLIPFIREWYFEVKIWMLGVLVATAARCCQWTELGNICMHTNLCIHTYLYFFLCVKYISDSNWVCFDPTRFADGLDVECEKRRVKDDSKVFGLSNWKDGVAIFRDGKTVSRTGFWVEFKSSVPDWLRF